MYAGLPPPADFSMTSPRPFSATVNFEMPKSMSLTVFISSRKRQSVKYDEGCRGYAEERVKEREKRNVSASRPVVQFSERAHYRA